MARESRTQRVEGIVLKHADFGEADRLVTLFTREEGKLRAIAKGARKPGSRKGGHLEPFTRVSLLLGKGREIPIVEQAEAVELNAALGSNLVALGYAAYVVELIDKFSADHDEHRGVYRLTRDTLQRLASGEDLQLAVRFFEVKLLEQMGFRPQLQQCAACGAEIQPEDQYFSFELGGAVCPRCGRQRGGGAVQRISLGALKVLRHLQRSDYATARRVQPSPPVQLELESLMNLYVSYLLERNLNTPKFLRRVRK
ncbi:MAG: DNA repair protein RecO [Anaerolineales bacterium]|nr:DNA repair protein RecO [Anaerolineales bacterium]QYK51318.1 MAG: DNA repair protein RecO [Anaerolineales bacterium]